MSNLTAHAAVTRVVAALEQLGVRGEVRVLDDAARTAQAAAEQLGVEVGQIANSLLFVGVPAVSDPEAGRHARDDEGVGEPLLVMTSGAHRVDTAAVAERIGVSRLRRADPEFVRRHTGQVIGGVSPIDHPAPIRTWIDPWLRRHDVVWAAAGHPAAVFSTTYDELVEMMYTHAR